MHLEKLEQILGHKFSSKPLLRQALTHPSVGYESRKKVQDNQRMEFLGDAVLQLVLTILLYEKFPDMDEGELTKLRAQLVNRSMLARIAVSLNLGNFLILGKGEELNQGRARPSNLADAMEALIGAFFQDTNFAKTNKWLVKIIMPLLEEIIHTSESANPKGELQELLQARAQGTPTYETVEESGPDHAKKYVVVVKIADEELGRGQGSSKRAAETEAANQALKKIKNDNESRRPQDAD